MKRSLKVADECQQKFIIVTYDLGIAKPALTIQAEESPTFDRLFIMIGGFHICLAYFKAVGKFIEESGGTHILTEAGVLAEGSMNGFITGTHYNRCKRIHPLLAAALEIIHFNEFCSNYDIPDGTQEALKKLRDKPSTFSKGELNDDLKTVVDAYAEFSRKTESGEHGKTAQYWFLYIKLIKIFHLFSRSIHTGNHTLFIYCIGQMSSLFFVFNQPNYARWLVRLQDNMLKMEETHPGIVDDFKRGALSIRRTEKNFSRSAIDITLEQTINANAASRLTGIPAFTNSISARQRWAQSHFMRTSIITNLFEELGLNKKEDVTAELRPAKMKKDKAQLSKVVEMIEHSLQPFSPNLDHSLLFNISSGKAASSNTADFLLNVFHNGNEARDKFIGQCCEDPLRFEQPIKRNKIHNFASDGASIKTKRSDGKVVEVRMERNLMGRLLYLALQSKVDIQLVLTYPLTPVPLSLCHLDATMVATDKSVLLRMLENKIESHEPPSIDCTIIDGMFFLHTLIDLPPTFGGIARHILIKLSKISGKDVHIVFDRTVRPSIKDQERDKRADLSCREQQYAITGAEIRRPSNFIAALRIDKFKDSLVEFLVKAWMSNEYGYVIGSKVLYATLHEKCYVFRNVNGTMQCSEALSLRSTHEEADSRMIYHISKSCKPPSNVVIRTNDTDVLVILLGNISKLEHGIHLWLEVGLQSKNSLRYIDVTDLAEKLGPLLCKSLPGFHCFTGSDYTAAFSRKGKVRPFQILEKSATTQESFASLGYSNSIKDVPLEVIEKFVCEMYGCKKVNYVNEARLHKFTDVYKPKGGSSPMTHIQGSDGSTMPPCKSVLQQKILRTNYVCGTWNQATKSEPLLQNPTENGWILENGKFKPKWFDGDQVPLILDTQMNEVRALRCVEDEYSDGTLYDYEDDTESSEDEE